jgi:hypothetical protein
MRVKDTFVPNLRRANYTEAKACSPIALSSFVVKKIVKRLDRHITEEIFGTLHLINTNLPTKKGSPLKIHCLF